jgi:hypothetical protein
VTLLEIKRLCEDALKNPHNNGLIPFVIKGRVPKGGRKRLFARGPMGECVSEENGGVVCLFKAQEVLDYLAQLREAIK